MVVSSVIYFPVLHFRWLGRQTEDSQLTTFHQLQENLRKTVLRRIDSGRLTGKRLAREAGFEQAHISNFLNCKRGLSLDGMDRVLAAQGMSVLDLFDAAEISKRASIPPPAEEGFDNVLLVDADTAASETIVTHQMVRDIYRFKRAFLRRLRPDLQNARGSWTRFVLIRAGPDAMSMYPRILPNATVLLDRHYNSLKPYRKGEPNLYGVRGNGHVSLSYVELSGKNLVLRPHNQEFPVELIAIRDGNCAADYLVGRICYVGIET
ncbi:MAG: hypothetical protein ABSD20_13255 [Terriglobales bacterium]|jgi:hypothetical protein